MKLHLTFLLATFASAFAAEETPQQLRAKMFRRQLDDDDGGAPAPTAPAPSDDDTNPEPAPTDDDGGAPTDDDDGGATDPPLNNDCPPAETQCDFCGNGLILNPDPDAIAVSSFGLVPPIPCATANTFVADLACVFSAEVPEACALALSEGIEEICCVDPSDCTDDDTVPEPAPSDDDTVPKPAPSDDDTVPEPAPSDDDTVPEPASDDD